MRRNEKKKIIQKVFYEPLFGRKIEIIESSVESYIGLKGIIVNETKNLLIIKTDKGLKKLLKRCITFKLSIDSKNLKIKGEFLLGDLVKRIKKIKKLI